MPPQLALFFYRDFPSELADHCKEITVSNGTTVFRLGKTPDCQIRLKHPTFSRIHLTLTYQPELKRWMALDGGIHRDTEEYSPSTNGTWLNGKQLSSGNPEPIMPSDKLCLGHPNAKIFVGHSHHDTVNTWVWDQPGWPNFQPKPTPKISDEELKQQIQSETSTPRTLVDLAADALDWFQEPSKSWIDVVLRLIVVAAIVAVIVVVWG